MQSSLVASANFGGPSSTHLANISTSEEHELLQSLGSFERAGDALQRQPLT